MNSRQFHRAVARATGESINTVQARGFSVLELDVPVAAVAGALCLSCPGCGRDVPLAVDGDELPDWAECDGCDIAYPYEDNEVFLPEDEFAFA